MGNAFQRIADAVGEVVHRVDAPLVASLMMLSELNAVQQGKACLRAKIDMASPFIVMRDPVLYRIKFAEHHQTGNKWCICTTCCQSDDAQRT